MRSRALLVAPFAAGVAARAAVIALLVVGCGSTSHAEGGSVAPTPRGRTSQQKQDLRALVSDFVAHIPQRGSGGYKRPSSSARSYLARAFHDLETGRERAAAGIARRYGFEVQTLTDSGRRLRILRERDPSQHGWGLYVWAAGSPSRVTVEVPHPIADRLTELVGVTAFRRLGAAALLVAGAHRYADSDGSADAAHRSDTVFAAIDRVAAPPGDVIVQLHGFDTSKHVGYGNVVVANGSEMVDATVRRAYDAFRRAGFQTCLAANGRCSALAATTNVEGQAARARGAHFLHVEMSASIRSDPAQRRRVAAALAAALAGDGGAGPAGG